MSSDGDSSALLEAIRRAAKPGLWSRGVSLARDEAVALESQSDDEVELRVRAPGRVVPVSVVLYPEDEEWDCDCGGRVDPCEHVVAAAISLRHAGEEGADGKPALQSSWSRVVYRLHRVEGGISVDRGLLLPDGSEKPLTDSLTSLVAGKARDTLQVEQRDLTADRLLERPTRGALNPERLETLLKALIGARNVLLDGKPIVVSDEEVLPRARVEEKRGQWVVTVDRAPEVDEVVARGVVRCGDSLARVGEAELVGASLEKLPLVRSLPESQLGELTSTVLPELAARMPVDVRTERLPRIDRELSPYVACEVTTLEDGVSILPTLVYGTPPCVRIDGEKMVFLRGAVPVRDEAEERRLVRSLREATNLAMGRRTTVPLAELPRTAEKLMALRCRLGGDADRLVRTDLHLVPRLDDARGEVSSDGDASFALGLSFAVEGGETPAEVDAAEVVRAWSEGQGLVALDGGGFVPLPHEWLATHGQLLADLLAARGADGTVAGSSAPALQALYEALDQAPPPSLERLLPLWDEAGGLPEATLPGDLQATLRPYQRTGVDWLAFLQAARLGGILADDMGLGKTLQTIAVLGTRALVVAPTSVLPNWQEELRRFRPSLRVSVYYGPGRQLDDEADVVLTTYAILRLDKELLAARRWDTAVLDEAQAIKNPQSQVAQAAFALDATFRLALSGTPVENRLEELWSLMHFANPGLLGGRRDFEQHVAQRIGDGDAGAAARLRKRIGPFVLRRLKQDVAPELPPRIESVLHVQLDDRERDVYEAVLASTKKEVVALLQQGGGVMKALEALLRLRQAACHAGLLPGQEASTSSKVSALVAALSSAVDNGHKALVFSQWTSLLDRVEPALEQAGIPYDRLDGSTQDRGAVTRRFSSSSGAPALLMSLKAGGTGLNLTAADHVFLLDPWWNPAAEAQAADRAHRIDGCLESRPRRPPRPLQLKRRRMSSAPRARRPKRGSCEEGVASQLMTVGAGPSSRTTGSAPTSAEAVGRSSSSLGVAPVFASSSMSSLSVAASSPRPGSGVTASRSPFGSPTRTSMLAWVCCSPSLAASSMV
jgi:superfamily II DNA or RNA helicase